ncbi:MAG: hypothetical protein HKN68_20320 [Saprospiraceae bacterium]|nr:hypothetical protein [Saprospiraceae bacterium]
MSEYKICLLTDIHLPRRGEKAMEVDTYKNLENVIQRIIGEQPDYIINAGDICFKEPVEETYLWFKNYMDSLNIPYSTIVGNHDDSKMMASIVHPELNFNKDTNELYYVKYINGIKFIFLDSGRGELSDQQWEWFRSELENDEAKYIIMHHPPVEAHVPHMDIRYSFNQSERFLNLLAAHKGEITIFTGHYHVERTILKPDFNIFITPSCFVQIDDRYEEFQADHKYPCFRNIYIEREGTEMISTVKYLYNN